MNQNRLSNLNEHEALLEAIKMAGGQTALANELSKRGYPTKQGHVATWVSRDKRAPAKRAAPIDSITGVSRHILRPDIFGPEPCRSVA